MRYERCAACLDLNWILCQRGLRAALINSVKELRYSPASRHWIPSTRPRALSAIDVHVRRSLCIYQRQWMWYHFYNIRLGVRDSRVERSCCHYRRTEYRSNTEVSEQCMGTMMFSQTASTSSKSTSSVPAATGLCLFIRRYRSAGVLYACRRESSYGRGTY